jgi:hypothetical protein
MDVDRNEEYQFENIEKVNKDKAANGTANGADGDDGHNGNMDDEIGDKDDGCDVQGTTEMEEDQAESKVQGDDGDNGSDGVQSYTGRATSHTGGVNAGTGQSNPSVPEYTDNDNALLMVNSLLNLNKGGRKVRKEEYMNAQSVRAQEEPTESKKTCRSRGLQHRCVRMWLLPRRPLLPMLPFNF